MTRGGANYRVKWQSYFSILRAPGALNTENTVLTLLTPSLVEKWTIGWLFFLCFFLTDETQTWAQILYFMSVFLPHFKMQLRISLRGHACPSVGPSVPCYYWTINMAVFESKKSSKDIKINDTISDDEVVASDVPPHCLFNETTHLYRGCVCPSVHPKLFRSTWSEVFRVSKYSKEIRSLSSVASESLN